MIYPTYHNDKDLEFVIEGHDLLGNEMFEKQTLYYKLGQNVRYVVPQFEDYYIEEDIIDFCIKESVHIDLQYRHYINSHIDILSDEGEVIYCGPLNNEYHELEYEDRFGEDKTYVLPCMFEGDNWCYSLPYIKGYYTNSSIIELKVAPHIILKDAYHKLAPIEIIFKSERGVLLDTVYIDPKEIPDESLKDNIYRYVIDIPNNLENDYYYEPVEEAEYIDIQLVGKYNKAIIKLNHYRTIQINNIFIDNDAEDDIYEKTVVKDILEGYKVGQEYTVIPDSIVEYYTDTEQFTFKIDEYYKYDSENDKYMINVDIKYYKLLTFVVYCLYNNKVIYEETMTGLHHNETYLYQAPEIPGYYTHTNYMYLRDTRNKTLHVEYHKNK